MPSKENIEVAVVQTQLHWEDVEANLDMFSSLLDAAQQADIYVLPEMFTTGFSMQPERFASKSQTLGVEWLKQTATKKQAAIVGSIMVEDGGSYYNRLYFVTPSQEVFTYNKKHLFSLGNEQQHYTAGTEKLLVEYLGWKICPMVCYDLRFPVWSRNTEQYDLLLYVANWPERRINHWRSLLIARAIENQCYVGASNRIGNDANNVSHNGNSMLVEYSGEVLQESLNETIILHQTLSKEALKKYRNAFPFLNDRDQFTM